MEPSPAHARPGHRGVQPLHCSSQLDSVQLLGTTPFFIELGTRRVYLAGITAHPDGMWVAQQARQHVWEIAESETSFRFLIHDRDRKFTACIDTVFQSEASILFTLPFGPPMPTRMPNAGSVQCGKSVWIIS